MHGGYKGFKDYEESYIMPEPLESAEIEAKPKESQITGKDAQNAYRRGKLALQAG